MNPLLSVLVVLVMLACVVLIPLGLPGLWLITGIVLVLGLVGSLPWSIALGVALAALVAEVAEFVVLKRFGAAFGGSHRAFWGAILGGMAGLFVGAPIPLVGPVVTAFVGTFLGAGLVTLLETRSLRASTRVGWGVVLARTVAVGLKVGVSLAVIGTAGFSLFLRR